MKPVPKPPLMEIPPKIRRLQESRAWWVVAVEALLAVAFIVGAVAIALSLVWRLIR